LPLSGRNTLRNGTDEASPFVAAGLCAVVPSRDFEGNRVFFGPPGRAAMFM
jgi:hypothetical protein